jgi:carbohydrate-binding DOMON domain-containing protein
LAVSAQPTDAPLSYDAMVHALTAESVEAAASFDAVIEANVPERFVSDPDFEWTGSGYESEVVEYVLEQKGPVAVQRLDNAVIVQLQRFSVVASRWIARGSASAE